MRYVYVCGQFIGENIFFREKCTRTTNRWCPVVPCWIHFIILFLILIEMKHVESISNISRPPMIRCGCKTIQSIKNTKIRMVRNSLGTMCPQVITQGHKFIEPWIWVVISINVHQICTFVFCHSEWQNGPFTYQWIFTPSMFKLRIRTNGKNINTCSPAMIFMRPRVEWKYAFR